MDRAVGVRRRRAQRIGNRPRLGRSEAGIFGAPGRGISPPTRKILYSQHIEGLPFIVERNNRTRFALGTRLAENVFRV
jgi:hypothetical protein